MLRRMVLIGLAAIGCGPVTAAPLDWLVGDWCTEGGRAQTCEHWAPARKGRMHGGSQAIRAGKIVEREVTIIRITRSGTVYNASPDGAPFVAFRQVARDGNRVTFENRAHDYPQRIRYWREGADLMAEISLADGSKPIRWHYLPARRPG